MSASISRYVEAVGRRRGVRCRLTQVFVLGIFVEVFEELARSRDVDDLSIVPNLCRVRRNLGQFDEAPFSIVEVDVPTNCSFKCPSINQMAFWQALLQAYRLHIWMS